MGTTTTNQSRAVIRQIEAGSYGICARCNERVKFDAKVNSLQRVQVICNVYEDGVWRRVEHYHPPCYDEIGQPHGVPEEQTRKQGVKPRS